MAWIYDTITGGQPNQWRLPFALWTTKLVMKVIQQELGISLSRWSVSRLLHHLGLSPQRPLFRATQQDPQRVAQWKQETFPKIKAEAHPVGSPCRHHLGVQRTKPRGPNHRRTLPSMLGVE